MIGCDTQTNPMGSNCSETYLEIDATDLTLDENGYYHMKFLEEYIQTFSTLRAKTGIDYQKIAAFANLSPNILSDWEIKKDSKCFVMKPMKRTLLEIIQNQNNLGEHYYHLKENPLRFLMKPHSSRFSHPKCF